jgi:hypothetical protein
MSDLGSGKNVMPDQDPEGKKVPDPGFPIRIRNTAWWRLMTGFLIQKEKFGKIYHPEYVYFSRIFKVIPVPNCRCYC